MRFVISGIRQCAALVVFGTLSSGLTERDRMEHKLCSAPFFYVPRLPFGSSDDNLGVSANRSCVLVRLYKTHPYSDTAPALSSDGRRLAFTSVYSWGGGDIYLLNLTKDVEFKTCKSFLVCTTVPKQTGVWGNCSALAAACTVRSTSRMALVIGVNARCGLVDFPVCLD